MKRGVQEDARRAGFSLAANTVICYDQGVL